MDKHQISQNVSETLEQNYMPYAMSVIVSRAIPEIDGLKPSHRKILYTMYKMGLLKGARTKSSNVVGQTMKLNPHGDQAIYETMVRLATGNESLLHPLVSSKGNFGKIYSRDMAYAAPRYTEVKLDDITAEMFNNIEKDAVDFVDNYDNTTKEPVLLPVSFPNILVNPNQGIAVGMASNIPSFNLREICDTTIALIEDSSADIFQTLKAPDFSTGAQLIYREADIKKIYETGRGGILLRSKYRYDKENKCIDIYEIPYSTTTEAIIDKIIDLVKKGKVKDITDVRDETDLKGLKITIDIKRSSDPEKIMSFLYRYTPLENNVSCNFNLLIKGIPKVLGIREILLEWIEFRIESIKRITLFEIGKKSEKLHLLEGLEKILMDIDLAIKIIRETEKESEVIPNLMNGFSIDEIQAEFIAEIKLRNLNKEYILKRVNEIEDLKKDIENLDKLYNSRPRLNTVIKKELANISKKFGKDRLTEIVEAEDVSVISKEELIEDYNVKFFLTEHGYIKKISLVSLRANPQQKLKDDDNIIAEVEGTNKSDVLFVSDKGNIYKIKAYELEDVKASSFGEYCQNVLELKDNENIKTIISTIDYSGIIIYGYSTGKFSEVELSQYETKSNRKQLKNAYCTRGDLVFVKYFSVEEQKRLKKDESRKDFEVVLITENEKALIFDLKHVQSVSSRIAQGNTILKLAKLDFVQKAFELQYSKLKDPDFYRIQSLPAQGYYLKKSDSKKSSNSLF